VNFADFARSKQGKPPGLARKAVSLGKVAASTAVRVARREPVQAPPELVALREAACRDNCPNLVVGATGEWCGKEQGCGCYLPAKRALVGPEIKCPLDRWPDQTPYMVNASPDTRPERSQSPPESPEA
jgi:hypothetical protein